MSDLKKSMCVKEIIKSHEEEKKWKETPGKSIPNFQ